MLKSRASIIFMVTCAVAIGTSLIVRTVKAYSSRVVPFTALTNTTLYAFPAGEFVRTVDEKYVVRSDGSNVKVRDRTAPSGTPYEVRGIINVPLKKGVTVDTLTKSTTTVYYNDQSVAKYTTKPTCQASSDTDVILGYRVYKQVEQLPPAEGEIRRADRWAAPDLDCFVLKEILYRGSDSSSMMAGTVTEVQSIVLGDPDPSLFEIPAGYTEFSPSQAFAERARILGIDNSKCGYCKDRDAALDSAYKFRQQLKPNQP